MYIYICLVFIYVFICVCIYIYIYIYNIPMLSAHSWVAGYSCHCIDHIYTPMPYIQLQAVPKSRLCICMCYRCNKTLHGSGFYIYIRACSI